MATSQSRKIATLISDAAMVRMTSNCSKSGRVMAKSSRRVSLLANNSASSHDVPTPPRLRRRGLSSLEQGRWTGW